jgi:hypothetical protein
VKINKKLEQNKLKFIKEKEWQVQWAELFFNEAKDFNKSISIIVFSLSRLSLKNNSEETSNRHKTQLDENMLNILKIDWNIQNYTQFSKVYGTEVKDKQKKLIQRLQELIVNKGGDLEEIRELQFEFNQVARKAHSEILTT